MSALPSTSSKKKKDEESDEEQEVDVLLKKAIILTTEVQFFEHYTPPTLEEGGILAGLPPTGDKPWRVEMSSDVLSEGGVKRTLRISRRGVLFFCDDEVVELSMSLAPVTMLEAVYESTWEPADGFVALDRAPLDRQGHPNPHPDIMCILQIPQQDIKVFEQICTIFGKCTRRTARRHRDAKPISIVQRHTFKNEMAKYAAKLAEEEELRKKMLEEGGTGSGSGVDGALTLPSSLQQEAKAKEEAEAREAAEIEAAARAEAERLKKIAEEEAEEKRLAQEMEEERKKREQQQDSPLLSPGTQALSAGDGFDQEEPEAAVVISINPFSHHLIHEPDVFDPLEDAADMTALDADYVRQKRDTDTDAQLFTQTRAVYFGTAKDDRTTAAVDTLSSLLQKGREVAALGSPSPNRSHSNAHHSPSTATPAPAPAHGSSRRNSNVSNPDSNTSNNTSANVSSTQHPLEGGGDNPLVKNSSSAQYYYDGNGEEYPATSVSPSRYKPFMQAYAFRETTRVQRAQLDAFFQDAEAERREQEQKEIQKLNVLLKDVKLMTKSIENGFKDAREHKLSGIGAPRRRTPPWLKPQSLRPPPTVPPPRMKIDVNSQAGKGRMLNPFGVAGVKTTTTTAGTSSAGASRSTSKNQQLGSRRQSGVFDSSTTSSNPFDGQ